MSGHRSQILGDFRPQKSRPITEECTPHWPSRYCVIFIRCPAVLVIVLTVRVLRVSSRALGWVEPVPGKADACHCGFCCDRSSEGWSGTPSHTDASGHHRFAPLQIRMKSKRKNEIFWPQERERHQNNILVPQHVDTFTPRTILTNFGACSSQIWSKKVKILGV